MKKKSSEQSNSNYMQYKGLFGTATVDTANNRIYGHVVGISDKISYEGASVEDLVAEFHASVDEYFEFCKQKGREPEKSFSGNILFRPGPEMHGELVQTAQKCGKSVNALLLDLVRQALHKKTVAG